MFLALPGAVSTTFGSPKVVMSVGLFFKTAPGAAYRGAGKVPAALAAKRAANSASAATAPAVASAGASVPPLGGSKAELAVPLEAGATAGAAAAGAAAAADGKQATEVDQQPAMAAGSMRVVDLSEAPTTSQETPYFVCECRAEGAGGGKMLCVACRRAVRRNGGAAAVALACELDRQRLRAGRVDASLNPPILSCADAVMAFGLYIGGMVLTALGTVRMQHPSGGCCSLNSCRLFASPTVAWPVLAAASHTAQ